MRKLNIESIDSGNRQPIEICLPRVFPWKPSRRRTSRHGGYHKVHHPHVEEN